jgi:quinol monooxygenase YgiN
MSVNVIVTFAVREESLADFRTILGQVKESLPTSPGCMSVRIFGNVIDPKIFTLVETWESESKHKSHLDALTASGAWKEIARHLTGDPVSSYYREI